MICRRQTEPNGSPMPQVNGAGRQQGLRTTGHRWPASTRLALTLSCCAGVALAAIGKEAVLRTESNRMVELTLKASRTYGDPFNEVRLDVTFIDPRGLELRVPAFWAGGTVVDNGNINATI